MTGWGIAGLAALVALIAGGTGCRREAGPAQGVVLLRQSPLPGGALREREPVVWEWSDAMRLDAGAFESASGMVAVLPDLPGRIQWRAPSILSFVPDSPWPAASNVLIRVSLPSSLAGRPFTPATFRFQGMPPSAADAGMHIGSVEPEEERSSAALRVVFSQPPAPDWKRYVKIEPSTNLTWESGTGALARIRGLVPGRRVELTFMAGLPARNGSVLTQDLFMAIQVADLKTRLRFQDRGHYLSSAGSRKVALESINVKAVKVSVWKIYTNNISGFARSSSLYNDREGSGVWNQSESEGDEVTNRLVKVEPGRNQVRQTVLDLGELTGSAASGLYYVMAEDADETTHLAAHKMVVLTDLGLTVIRNEREVLVWAMSIGKGTPVAGVTVTALSAKNQLVASAVTDERGLALISRDPLPPLGIVTGEKGDAFAMIKLDEALVQGVVEDSGRGFLSSGYEAFLYADRGIYRPGESARIRAIVRGPLLACPTAFPVQLLVRRPDGLTAARLTALLSGAGTADFEWPCPPEALTGRYALELEAGGPGRSAGSLSLMVEDFVPPTLAVTLTGPAGRVSLAEPVTVSVKARYLFGSPAEGKRASLRARLGPAPFQSARFPDFVFGDPRQPPVWRTIECGEDLLDFEGRAEFAVPFPADLNPGAALSCTLAATVIEDSGRACPAVCTFPVDAKNRYIGLKSLAENASAGAPARFQAVRVDPSGAPAVEPAPLSWTLSRVTWIWREETDPESGSRFRFDPVKDLVREGSSVPASNGVAEIVWDHALEGEYELAVDTPSGAGASMSFYVSDGSGWGGTRFRQPDQVAVRFDKERYRAGEEAVVTLQAPFPGQALISLENSRLCETRVLAMTNTTLQLRVPVKPDYWPNLYVRAVVVRPQEGTLPDSGMTVVRATGVAAMKVGRPEKSFQVDLSVPERVKPASPLTVEVRVSDAEGHPVSCEVTVAAVDEGILQLTGYGSPDPLAFFSTSRGLFAWLYDGYALLLPDPDAVAAAIRLKTGGDAMGAEMAGRLNPIRGRRFTPVALWSGTLRTEADGRASVILPVPEFSGQLRVTAVAAAPGGFGYAAKPVVVRRDWVVLAGLPRAASPGDQVSMHCQVFNESQSAGEADLSVSASGAMTGGGAPVRVELKPGENKEVNLPLRASSVGIGQVQWSVHAGDDQWVETVEIPVHPPWPRVTLAGIGALPSEQVVKLEFPGEWVSNVGTGKLVCSGSPGLEKLGSLDFLDEYPYGCLEQTLSRAFPYLVAADLLAAGESGYRDPALIAERVNAGIRRVLAMQTGGGGFSLWPREAEVYDWGTAYAVLFLARARDAGYAVPAEAVDRACSYLERQLAGWLRDRKPSGWACAATALTALGSAGRPDQAALARLMQEKNLDPDCRAWLIQALLASGRRAEAASSLARAGAEEAEVFSRDVGDSLASSTRTDALLLDAWLQVDPASPAVPVLAGRLLGSQRTGSWATTQDNAWALLALGRYARQKPSGRESCRGLVVSGNFRETWRISETNELGFSGPAGLQQVTLRNTGEKTLYYAWTAAGIPKGGTIPEEDHGMRIRRQILGREGKPLDGMTFKKGELVVVKLTVEGMTRPLDNVVVEEPLPGGLEFENPNLPNGYAAFIPENEARLPVRYLSLRDDRLIAFSGAVEGVRHLYYLARAVTAGSYIWPPATASCMYAPAIHSLTGSGRITVEP
jgi:uncharacterized protein YfaS (alpha-2-macroglobulin family)